MDYSRFRIVAVVDWIDLEVRTLEKHPAWRIQKTSAGAVSYFTGLDPATGQDIKTIGTQGANTPTTRFAVRIQAPERLASIMQALDMIKDRDPLADITVRGIEIAFDACRLDGATDEHLAEMTGYMLRTINRPEGSNDAPRSYSWRGTPDLRYGGQQVLAAIRNGKTAMYGNKDDDYIVRGYLKNYDAQRDESGKYQRVALASQDHRARIEVRLQGAACPMKTLDDLKDFKFESLARFFKFHESADGLPAIETLVTGKAGSLGTVIDQAGRTVATYANRGRSRKTKNNTLASPLNEIARDQLRNLTLRWRCEAGRARRRSYGNSGSKTVAGPASNYLNEPAPQHHESACQIREISASAPPSKLPEISTSGEGVLNTSLGELLPILHDLHQADYPPLPDLTINQDET